MMIATGDSQRSSPGPVGSRRRPLSGGEAELDKGAGEVSVAGAAGGAASKEVMASWSAFVGGGR